MSWNAAHHWVFQRITKAGGSNKLLSCKGYTKMDLDNNKFIINPYVLGPTEKMWRKLHKFGELSRERFASQR